MNICHTRRVILSIAAGVLTLILFGGLSAVNSTLSASSQPPHPPCASDKEYKLCLKNTELAFKDGEDIVLHFSVENQSRRKRTLNRSSGSSYFFNVTTEAGEILPTVRQQTLERPDVSENELRDVISSSWISRRPDPVTLEPEGVYQENVRLNGIYEMKPGVYGVDAIRKIAIPDVGFIELKIVNIRITIKDSSIH